jgi:hypothetical protein
VRVRRRQRRPDVGVASGERVLAWAATGAGVVAGTREALYLPGDAPPAVLRVPWEQVETADWDAERSQLRVREVGTWGERRPEHLVTLAAPVRLLQLVRERVSATVVVQRHVPVTGRRGLRVIARRAPAGDRPVTWMFEYDEGVDPDDPLVREAAESALAQAMQDVGPT